MKFVKECRIERYSLLHRLAPVRLYVVLIHLTTMCEAVSLPWPFLFHRLTLELRT